MCPVNYVLQHGHAMHLGCVCTVVEKSLHQCASVHIGEQRDMKAEIVRAVLIDTPTPPEAIYELVYDKDTDELETGNIRCDCERPISGRVALAGAGGNTVLSERKERTERGGHALDKDEHHDVEICPDQEVAENKEGVKDIPNAHGPGGRAEEGEMEAGCSEAGTRRRRRGGEGGPGDTAGLRRHAGLRQVTRWFSPRDGASHDADRARGWLAALGCEHICRRGMGVRG